MSLAFGEIKESLAELGLNEVIASARRSSLVESFVDLDGRLAAEERIAQQLDERRHLAETLERFALSGSGELTERRELLAEAFICRRAIDQREIESPGERLFHLALLCADAILAERTAELSLLLREDIADADLAVPRDLSWETEVEWRAVRALILLCRRAGGWMDIRAAAQEIDELREAQASREPNYFGAAPTSRHMARLLAEYNLARILDLTVGYVIEGKPADALARIDRHHSYIVELLEYHPDPSFEHITDLLRAACREMVRASVWSDTRRLGKRVRDFVDELADPDREHPIIELWPSQRTALGTSLLDPAKRAVVVEMPTSAGKTLVAEFAIVQALALNPGSRVAYIVPTRALVNQITQRLRRDLSRIGFSIEAAVPVFEMDPTEDLFLREEIDVLVTTPEKLDLLIRQGHPAVAEVSLVVADEAHNIADGGRGARLELLLGMLKRERAEARFVLLTPFVPNAEQLAQWLGDDAEARISVDWKPTEAVTVAAQWVKPRGQSERLQLVTLPSPQYVDFPEEVAIDGGVTRVQGNRNRRNVTVSTSLALSERGAVLVLCRGTKTAENLSGDIARHRGDRAPSEFGAAVAAFAASELGTDHPLVAQLRRGVAFHHAGLSHDLRFLIEQLIDSGEVDIVAGTTTLAQGVNFPLASVVFETLKKPGPQSTWIDLSFSEFWNIAGRAGRALQDRVGVIAFPSTGAADIATARSYLQRRAAELVSVLLEVVDDIDDLVDDLNLGTIRKQPAFAAFLQYLVHALRVAGYETATAEAEDLLRSSLVYHQIAEGDPTGAERLVRAARRYLDSLSDRPRGLLALADGTGFSLSTVDMIFARQREEYPEFVDRAFWRPDALFADDTTALTGVIKVIADIPELTLARTAGGPFDPAAVAGIVRDWVHGETVSVIADRWFPHEEDADQRRREASRYLYSKLVGQVPWGMGALQRLVLGSQDAAEDVGYVPSLVFYGVATKEAAALRMAGVPRIAAEGLGEQLRQSGAQVGSFQALRSWLGALDEATWETSGTRNPEVLSGRQARIVWRSLTGAEDTTGATG